MIKKILLFCVIFSFQTNYSQDTIGYFSDVLRSKIKVYNKASDEAFENRDLHEGKRLFDSLVHYDLIGTKFDDFTVKTYSSKKVELKKIEQPLFIATYASWCIINKGDPQALNKLAKEYTSEIKIMVLFWDRKENIKKLVRQFDKDILICYANEKYAQDSNLIARLKHTLGLPITFFIDANKNVINIDRIPSYYDPKLTATAATAKSYEKFKTSITTFLSQKN